MSPTDTLDALAASSGDTGRLRELLVISDAVPAVVVANLSDGAVKFIVAGILIGASFAASAGAT